MDAAPKTPGTFDIVARDGSSAARAGVLWTAHGPVETPVFMPVGTQATVKALEPRDLDEARRFLRELSGNTHSVFTGVAFNGKTAVCRSLVKFRPLTDEEIDEYVAKVNPLDRAGAYDIDVSGDFLIESWQGERENIMGLPVAPLKEWGIVK